MKSQGRTPGEALKAVAAGLARRGARGRARPNNSDQARRLVDAALARLVAVAFPNMDASWRQAAANHIRQTIATHKVAWAEHQAAERRRRRAAPSGSP
jgi:hypothetical protein